MEPDFFTEKVFLLCCGSFCCRSFSCGGLCCGSGFGLLCAATAGGLLGLFLAGSKCCLVEVHEFYKNHFCGVTLTEAGVEDTEVSTGTIGHLGSDGAEEFCSCLFVLQIAEDNAAGVSCIFF